MGRFCFLTLPVLLLLVTAGSQIKFYAVAAAAAGMSASTTIAGSFKSRSLNGYRSAATFITPAGMTFDSAGVMYVADAGSNQIRKISTDGQVYLVAGSPNFFAGSTNNIGSFAKFSNPQSVYYDVTNSCLYVADAGNNKIRLITNPSSNLPSVTTIVGSGGSGTYVGGFGLSAIINSPRDVCLDESNPDNMYIVDYSAHAIKLFHISVGDVSIIIGSTVGSCGSSNGIGTYSKMCYPTAVLAHTNGNVYISDTNNRVIRQYSPTTFLVTSFVGPSSSSSSFSGLGTYFYLNYPRFLALNRIDGSIIAVDNSRVLAINPNSGRVTTLACGNKGASTSPSIGTYGLLLTGMGVAVDSSGNIFISDKYAIKSIDTSLGVSIYAGSYSASSTDGVGTFATFSNPFQAAIDSSDNLYVTDATNNCIRRVASITNVVSTIAGSANYEGFLDGVGTTARFYSPQGIAIDARFTTLYVSDTSNHVIRVISSDGAVATIAGNRAANYADGYMTYSSFNYPNGLAFTTLSSGLLYICDTNNHLIRLLTLSSNKITLIAGLTSGIRSTNDGYGTYAGFYYPRGITVATSGEVYVADTSNHIIRMISTDSFVVTIAGTPGLSGSANGYGTYFGSLSNPRQLAFAIDGSLLTVDNNNRIRVISLANLGFITTISGGSYGYSDGLSTLAAFNNPYGIVVDSNWNIIVVDTGNDVIRKFTISLPTSQPSSSPSRQPSKQPTSKPSLQPFIRPSGRPSRQPTVQPSRQPSMQPSSRPSQQPLSSPSQKPSQQPTSRPSVRPSLQPSQKPYTKPSKQPTSRPSSQPSSRPSWQPLRRPSGWPSSQPSSQPLKYPTSPPSTIPSGQPSKHPRSKPSRQPSVAPSNFPTSQPTARPSLRPSSIPIVPPSNHPSSQPSLQPILRPSNQPSRQPLGLPTSKPSCSPSTTPSSQPTIQPNLFPSSQPTRKPSRQPSSQPSRLPSTMPSPLPTTQPSHQPSGYPSCEPTLCPTGLPSKCPSSKPSICPTRLPTSQPSSDPSMSPTFIPTKQPSNQPTLQPSSQPSIQPSAQPSRIPTRQPSGQPSMFPSRQPNVVPSSRPSLPPTCGPSTQPSGIPSKRPSCQPSCKPSHRPTSIPSRHPSCQPSRNPSRQPSLQPSRHPSRQPIALPSRQPSRQPFSRPSRQPTRFPSLQPSVQPVNHPSSQPVSRPTGLPTAQPFIYPTADPTAQPAGIPSAQPKGLPTSLPSNQPVKHPSSLPTSPPSPLPSSQPVLYPSAKPTRQPVLHPSSKPSVVPSAFPSSPPNSRPTSTPTKFRATSVNSNEQVVVLASVGSSVIAVSLIIAGLLYGYYRRFVNSSVKPINASSFHEIGSKMSTTAFPSTQPVSADGINSSSVNGALALADDELDFKII